MTKILTFNFLLFFFVSHSQIERVRGIIQEKYKLSYFEVIPPNAFGRDSIDYSAVINYFIKTNNGNLRIFNTLENSFFPEVISIYQNGIGYSIGISKDQNGKMEWIIFQNDYSFQIGKWEPIRISFETYDKIFFSDATEWPGCIGLKNLDKTFFRVDIANHKTYDERKVYFYGDTCFLKFGKSYFPFGYGRIIPVELNNCVESNVFCNTKKIVYRYSDDYFDQEVAVIDPLTNEMSYVKKTNNTPYFDEVLWTNYVDKVIVKKHGFMCLYDFQKSKYTFKNIDGFNEKVAYSNTGVYLIEADVFLPLDDLNNVRLTNKIEGDDLIVSIENLDFIKLRDSDKKYFEGMIKIDINLTQEKVKKSTIKGELTSSFEELIKNNELLKRKLENISQKLSDADVNHIEPIYMDTINNVKLKLYNEKYADKAKNLSVYFNSDHDYRYFSGISVKEILGIDYQKILNDLNSRDTSGTGAVVFYHIFLNNENASLRARINALDELIKTFSDISELYYFRSKLIFCLKYPNISNLKDDRISLNDIDKALQISPTLKNHIRRACSYANSENKEFKVIVLQELDSAIRLLEESKEDNYLLHDLYCARIRLIEHFKLPKSGICKNIQLINKLLEDKSISKDSLFDKEIEWLQKYKCKTD
jgi:hypothetical protein